MLWFVKQDAFLQIVMLGGPSLLLKGFALLGFLPFYLAWYQCCAVRNRYSSSEKSLSLQQNCGKEGCCPLSLYLKLLQRFPKCFLGWVDELYSSTVEMYPYTPGSMVTAMMRSNATRLFDREESYAHVNLPWERFHGKVLISTARDFPALKLLESEKRQRE